MHAVMVHAGLLRLIVGTVRRVAEKARTVGHRITPGVEQIGNVTRGHTHAVVTADPDRRKPDRRARRPTGIAGCLHSARQGGKEGCRQAGLQQGPPPSIDQCTQIGRRRGVADVFVIVAHARPSIGVERTTP